jgi:hypothetical protein
MTAPEPPVGSVVRDGRGSPWVRVYDSDKYPNWADAVDLRRGRRWWDDFDADTVLLASAGEWADRLPTPTDEQPDGEYTLGWNDCRSTLRALGES